MQERRDRQRIIIRCAYLQYKAGLTQTEIAKRLKIPRPTVSRYIKEAEQSGVVKIEFSIPRYHELEMLLIERFRLRDAIVVMVADPSFIIADSLGIEAAKYFERIIGNGAKIGFAGGITIQKMVNALVPGKFSGLAIYPLSVGGIAELIDVSTNTLIGIASAKYPETVGYGFQIPSFATGPVEDAEEEKKRFLDRPDVKKIYDGAMGVDFAFTGIGYLHPKSTLGRTAEYLGFSLDRLKEMGAVGDINYQVFDATGHIIDCELNRRIIGIPAKQLQTMTQNPTKRVVAVAGGKEKTQAILGALKGQFFNTLITDEDSANRILELAY
jgi:DNA-binding transcriptional regulator LsrR (DeoR family)